MEAHAHSSSANRSVARRTAAVPLLLLLSVASAARADSRVRDGGNFFSADVAAKVSADLDSLAASKNTSVIVETFAAAPQPLTDQLKSATDAAGRTAAFDAYGLARAKELNADFYIFATRQPGHVQTQTQANAHQAGLSNGERDRVTSTLVQAFRQQQFDRGLTDAVAALRAGLEGTAAAADPGAMSRSTVIAQPKPRPDPRQEGSSPRPKPETSGGSFLPWILLGGVALVIFMIIRALRTAAASRMGGGGYGGPGSYSQPGYGQPGYGAPGYGPPASGGFGRGLMGGLLGGMAGGYLANRAFGQSNTTITNNDPTLNNDAAAGGLFGSGSNDAGGDTSGIQFGDSGGGDFGGGGDAGGGDFGGGGGGGGDSAGGDF